MTDQELKDLVAGLAISQDRTDQELKALLAQSARTDARIAASSAATDAKIAASSAATDAKIAASSMATDAKIDKMQETIAATIDKMQKTITSVGQQLGNIGENQGAVAEEFFYNSLSDRPTVGGISFDRVIKNVGAGKPGRQVEFDIVMHNGTAMAIVEVKYKVHPNSLDQLEKHMRRYRELFPEYKGHKLYGGVAGFSVPDDVVEQAHERGLFVLQRKGDVVEADTASMRAF